MYPPADAKKPGCAAERESGSPFDPRRTKILPRLVRACTVTLLGVCQSPPTQRDTGVVGGGILGGAIGRSVARAIEAPRMALRYLSANGA